MRLLKRAADLLSLMLCLTLSASLQAHGDLSGRVAEVRKEVAQHPEDGERQLTLGGLLFQNGDFAEALVALDGLDRMVPGKFPTDKLRGSALLALQRPAEARAALDQFLARFPGDGNAVLYRARALTALSQKDAALSDYREALRLASAPEPDLFQEVAAALASAGHQDEALALLERGLKLLGSIPSLTQRALEIELSQKRFDAALARVEAMSRTSPRPEQWMARRAAILTTAGHFGVTRGMAGIDQASRRTARKRARIECDVPAGGRSANGPQRIARTERYGGPSTGAGNFLFSTNSLHP